MRKCKIKTRLAEVGGVLFVCFHFKFVLIEVELIYNGVFVYSKVKVVTGYT